MSDSHELNTDEEDIDVEKEVGRTKVRERFKINVKEVIAKLLLFLSSIWLYVPIVLGISAQMIWMMPLAYTSWLLFLSFGGDWAEVGFGIGLTGDKLPLGIVVIILAIIIFFAGVTLFIWGIIQIVERIRKKGGNHTSNYLQYIFVLFLLTTRIAIEIKKIIVN